MADDETPEEAEEIRFHEDDNVNSGLIKLNEKAGLYRLAHAILTGKFDQNFAQWRAAQKIDRKKTETLFDLTELTEYVMTTATVNDLFLLQEKLNDLITLVIAEQFGRYSEKNVRGMIPEGITRNDLKGMREDLINVLDGTLNMAKNGMLPAVMADPATLEALPEIKPRTKRGEGLVWDFPDAPKPEDSSPVSVSQGTVNNFRGHNTGIRIVINGEIPEDHPAKLGDACEKYFDGKTAKQVGAMFGGWSVEYFGDGNTEPKKIVKRGDTEYYWTTAAAE